MRGFGLLALLGLAMLPTLALSDAAPEVVFTSAGNAANQGGAINRFTMRFSEAMVALGDPRATAPGKMTCSVASTGRWVDPQTYVFDFTEVLPGGLSCKVELNPGLKSARGEAVGGSTQFSIDTGGPQARAVLPSGGDGIEEGQVFLVATNVAATPASIAANGYCAVDGVGEKIALDVLGTDMADKIMLAIGDKPWWMQNFLSDAGLPQKLDADSGQRPAAQGRVVAVKCRRPLPPGKDVALVWGKGIASINGHINDDEQRFDFTVRDAFEARFECSRVNPRAGCNPVTKAHVRFTAPIPMEQAKAVKLTFADGSVRSPSFSDDDKNSNTVADLDFAGPFPAAMNATVTLPGDIVDQSGRHLANAQRFPLSVRFDAPPPLVKFAASFGIIEAKEGGVLPVTVRAVEPALAERISGVAGASLRIDGSDGQIAAWLRRVDKADDDDQREEVHGGHKVDVNYTGATSLLGGTGAAMHLSLPGKGKDFEVIGIPLTRPGFYVVELASPVLGQSLLGRPTPRYVATGALVTNMAVHFKWGRASSLAWVTTLDGAQPVAGADVRVTDSCTGKELVRGKSDAQGRLLVTSGLPSPESYGDCDAESTNHPLMVSARSNGDFSFTLTQWGKGIEPYDFELPYGGSDASDNLIHTVFDRSLVKAGESVNMKHILRRSLATGFGMAGALKGTLRLSHRGSETQFDMPFSIGADGAGENSWTVPKSAPMGDYDLSFIVGDKTIVSSQALRVDEYRLPTMRATISGPKDAMVRPSNVPLDLYVGYLSGGPAGNMPVAVRTAYSVEEGAPHGWEGWTFGGQALTEGTRPLNEEGGDGTPQTPQSSTLPATLNAAGVAHASMAINTAVDSTTAMMVEMDYQDANGETLTAQRSFLLHPSAVRLGIKTDGWLMRNSDLRLKLVALGVDGKPKAGQRVTVALYSRETLTARRRLIGGFYAYDNQEKVTKLSGSCGTSTDAQGLALCTVDAGVSGQVTAVATTTDNDGNVSRAVTDVWLAGDDDWWFGGDNGDRMDLVPEQKAYKAGETAKFQVRMPFREATALVTVEREGVLSSFVTTLSGKDPVIEVLMPAAYAPNVYVSALVVRGRVGGFSTKLSQFARNWHLPFFDQENAEPTALVDLAKPSYRLGVAKVAVGWEGHALDVKVKTDKPKYAVRETANVDVSVTQPDGKPAASAEIAFVAVDEALLQLQRNDSWKLLDAMMGERSLNVLTSTAQTQVVGKRHYGKKAVEAGGGGGGDVSAVNRDDFRPVLLWKGRVPLDANGHAQVQVPMSDALSAFRLVAIATQGVDRFGTGETSVRTSQDLQIFSALPPLVRSGDYYGASFTLRNASDHEMKVTATAKVDPAIANGKPLTVTIPAGGAVPVTWNLHAPDRIAALNWQIEAQASDGHAADNLSAHQDVIPAVPTEVWASSLLGPDAGAPFSVVAPVGALPGSYVDVKLTNSLAPPMEGVRAYMTGYPYNCFEQQLSRAVVLNDPARWGALAGALPTYLDSDGLLRYWPSERMQGSEALTAYALSMTAEAEFAIPDAPKAKMIEALKNVVEGRLSHEAEGPNDKRLLKIAALAALARNGASTPALVGAIDTAASDMPTALLADWMVAIDKTQGLSDAATKRAAADKVLRQRIVYEGSRFDLVDKASAPWWMMVGGDEMAIKALNAVLGRNGWQGDAPRMMIGVAMRQQRGSWDTTPANAWGSIAVRRFANLYPASAIAGVTQVALGGAVRSVSWPVSGGSSLLRLPMPNGASPLTVTQSGGTTTPWAAVSVSAAVPLVQPLMAGYKLTKAVSMVTQKNKGRLTRGDVMKVTLTVDATADRNWVVLDDPVPPGATIMGDLGGQSSILSQTTGGEGAQPSYVERAREGWRGYFQWVPAGRFVVEYTVRLNGTGTFNLPPTKVMAMYSPDIRALVPNKPVTVAMK